MFVLFAVLIESRSLHLCCMDSIFSFFHCVIQITTPDCLCYNLLKAQSRFLGRIFSSPVGSRVSVIVMFLLKAACRFSLSFGSVVGFRAPYADIRHSSTHYGHEDKIPHENRRSQAIQRPGASERNVDRSCDSDTRRHGR